MDPDNLRFGRAFRERSEPFFEGNSQWMAPEVLQAVLRNNSDPEHAGAVDIWILGCTVIEMFTGKPPWDELTKVQAMFSMLHKTPPIPETLSSEGKDFLKQCLQREPMNRPSAAELLDHPFLQNIREKTVATCTDEFYSIKLLDLPSSPKDSNQRNKEPMLFPSNNHASPIRRHFDSKMVPRSHLTNPECAQSANNSPRSILEIIRGIHMPEPKCSPSHVSASNSPDSLLIRARKSSFFARSQERRLLHL